MKVKGDKRNYIIGGLLILVLFMTVGFAAFRTTLTINGTASISSNWCVGFDNTKTNTYQITKGKASGTNPSATMGYDGTACSSTYVPIANLGANFYQPGDKIEYTLTIANKGSIDAAIESITVDGVSVTSNQTKTKGNIIWKVNMPASTTLAATTGTTTMVVSAEFQNTTDLTSYSAHESQSITVGINAVQGSTGMDITPAEQKVYAWNTDTVSIGTSTLQDIGTTYPSCSATGKNYCLRYTIENDTVTGAEVCFISDTEHCMKGGDGGASFSANTQIIKDFQTFNNLPDNANPGCYFNSSSSYCYGGGFGSVSAGSGGSVYVGGSSSEYCIVGTDGNSTCNQ